MLKYFSPECYPKLQRCFVSIQNFKIPPSGQTLGIRTFEDWIVQINAPSKQNVVQILHPIVGFVCEVPLLKNNRRRLVSSLIKTCVEKCQPIFSDPLYDDAFFLPDLS